MIGLQSNSMVRVPYKTVLEQKKTINLDLYEISYLLS